MQVLAGDIESAIQGHLVFWHLWDKYSALPESWDWEERRIQWAGWPGRPEFIESTYYLYRVSSTCSALLADELATKDPFYLRVGERVLSDMKARTMTKCGFATMKNVETGDVSLGCRLTSTNSADLIARRSDGRVCTVGNAKSKLLDHQRTRSRC